MVNYNADTLDATFTALADRTRRDMIAALARHGELTLSVLAEPFQISLPAVMKHLRVLTEAGLVRREKRGRTVYCQLNEAAFRTAGEWLAHHERFWHQQLDRLDAYLGQEP
ncbi:MAG: ArsR/SmtB family transcription factor [Gammaproteobacteria bacterium]